MRFYVVTNVVEYAEDRWPGGHYADADAAIKGFRRWQRQLEERSFSEETIEIQVWRQKGGAMVRDGTILSVTVEASRYCEREDRDLQEIRDRARAILADRRRCLRRAERMRSPLPSHEELPLH